MDFLRWLMAVLHFAALGIGLGAIWVRYRALRSVNEPGALQRAFAADNLWALAFALWLGSGLMRAFGGLEKGTPYYLQNGAFHLKLGLLGLILLLEIRQMVTLIRWRVALKKGQTPDLGPSAIMARISLIQAILVLLMIGAASAMARGFGL